MSFLKFLKKHPKIEEFRESKVQFVCEQNGPSEQDLKRALVALLEQNESIERAYLVCIRYSSSGTLQVALGLEAETQNQELVTAISEVFGRLFSSKEHLDILYLSLPQCQEIRQVARPFFSRGSAQTH
jgi:hypothetical protein